MLFHTHTIVLTDIRLETEGPKVCYIWVFMSQTLLLAQNFMLNSQVFLQSDMVRFMRSSSLFVSLLAENDKVVG